MVQLWFSCGLVGLLCDGGGSVWFRFDVAWCSIVHLRFSFGSAWHGMIVYGSVYIMLLNSSALVQLWLSCGCNEVTWYTTVVVQLWFRWVVV